MIERSSVVQQILDLFENPSYLEVGVDQGDTFRFIIAAHKVAVDPNFKFALPPNTSAVEYHPVTSDEYFASRCPALKCFDVVYLDGLHTFEQTLRDMLNAVLRLKSGGIVIIDDVLPASYHSALPSLDDAFRVRDYLAAGNPALIADNTWMGDVYKLAFFVQTFMQQLSYATVQENHGQLILWSAVRPAAAMAQRSMLDVAVLSFADTVLKRSVFQIQPFQTIMTKLRHLHAAGTG
jgi:hypothetical protein